MFEHGPALSRALAALALNAADALLPRACAGCARVLPRGACRSGWCEPCLAALGSGVSRCGQCAIESLMPICESCRTTPPPFARTVMLGAYAPPLDRIVRALKFNRQPALGAALAATLAPIVQRELARLPRGILGTGWSRYRSPMNGSPNAATTSRFSSPGRLRGRSGCPSTPWRCADSEPARPNPGCRQGQEPAMSTRHSSPHGCITDRCSWSTMS